MGDEHKCDSGAEIVIGPEVGEGQRLAIRHTEDHQIEAGVIRQVKDGESLPEDSFHVEQIEGNRYKYTKVERPGPARVTTPAYRDGWDRIFGGKQAVGQA